MAGKDKHKITEEHITQDPSTSISKRVYIFNLYQSAASCNL